MNRTMSTPLRAAAIVITAGVLLAGCAGGPPPAAPASAADRRAAAPAALAAEAQWLNSWFSGTPVAVVLRNDGVVTVDVPLAFCFDPGRSRVKPALAAVLDKVAESLRRTPLAQLQHVAAPPDANGSAALAAQRATQVRNHLLSHGAPPDRIGPPTTTTAAAVQLRLEAAQP